MHHCYMPVDMSIRNDRPLYFLSLYLLEQSMMYTEVGEFSKAQVCLGCQLLACLIRGRGESFSQC